MTKRAQPPAPAWIGSYRLLAKEARTPAGLRLLAELLLDELDARDQALAAARLPAAAAYDLGAAAAAVRRADEGWAAPRKRRRAGWLARVAVCLRRRWRRRGQKTTG